LLHLEEARPRYELCAVKPAEQGDQPVVQLEGGVEAELLELTGQVDEPAAAAVGAGGEDEQPARREQPSAAGEDLGERGGEGRAAAAPWPLRQLGEVLSVVRVAVVVLLDRRCAGAHLSVQRAAIGR